MVADVRISRDSAFDARFDHTMPYPRPDPPIDPQRPSPEVLLWAYSQGLFPMADPHFDHLDWFSPDPRALMPLDDRFHVPKSLGRVVRSGRFDLRLDSSFERVITACAQPRLSDELTWISDTIIECYTALHQRGHAHSVEAWLDDTLVGGLYGVHLGAAFFGESMFSRPDLGGTNASKVCLVHLVEYLRSRSFQLLDTQFTNQHLEQFGVFEMPRAEYLKQLEVAVLDEHVQW